MRENGIEESIDRPLTIALVVDTVGNQGNGTSNSALQWAAELERQGHHVRLVGIGAPEYPARVNKVPLVSWVAAKQLMQFAEPSDTLFRTAFQGVDVVHIYMPFKFGRRAAKVAHQMGIPVTAGFHLQPENVLPMVIHRCIRRRSRPIRMPRLPCRSASSLPADWLARKIRLR